MTEAEKVHEAQDFITRLLQKQGGDRTDAMTWEQTPQGRVTRVHRLVIIRGGEKSIFTFTEYELLKDYGSKKWENQLLHRVGNILMEYEMSERIGETLVRIGEIDTTQIDIICAKQLSGDKRKFGEIGQELGYINEDALHHYLEAKKAWKASKKESSVGKIGDLLIRIGAMKSWQVQDVLQAQKSGDSRLFGEIAIQFGYVNDEVVKKYIEAKETWGKEA